MDVKHSTEPDFASPASTAREDDGEFVDATPHVAVAMSEPVAAHPTAPADAPAAAHPSLAPSAGDVAHATMDVASASPLAADPIGAYESASSYAVDRDTDDEDDGGALGGGEDDDAFDDDGEDDAAADASFLPGDVAVGGDGNGDGDDAGRFDGGGDCGPHYDESLPDGRTVRRRRRSRDESSELSDADKDVGLAMGYKEEGNRHFGGGEHDSAAACYTEALRSIPSGAAFDGSRGVFHSNRAACYLHMGRVEDALYDCDRALEYSPGYAKALARRAAALERLGKLEEAARGEGVGGVVSGS